MDFGSLGGPLGLILDREGGMLGYFGRSKVDAEKTWKQKVTLGVPPPRGPFGDTWATLGDSGPTFSSFVDVMWVVGATIAVLMAKTSTRGWPNVPKP